MSSTSLLFDASDTDQQRIRAVGSLLYGNRWRVRLAAAMGVTPQALDMAVHGRSALTAPRRLALAKLCREFSETHPQRAAEVAPFEAYWRETAATNFRPDNLTPRDIPAAQSPRRKVSLASISLVPQGNARA